jgi:hypothetical protein
MRPLPAIVAGCTGAFASLPAGFAAVDTIKHRGTPRCIQIDTTFLAIYGLIALAALPPGIARICLAFAGLSHALQDAAVNLINSRTIFGKPFQQETFQKETFHQETFQQETFQKES